MTVNLLKPNQNALKQNVQVPNSLFITLNFVVHFKNDTTILDSKKKSKM